MGKPVPTHNFCTPVRNYSLVDLQLFHEGRKSPLKYLNFSWWLWSWEAENFLLCLSNQVKNKRNEFYLVHWLISHGIFFGFGVVSMIIVFFCTYHKRKGDLILLRPPESCKRNKNKKKLNWYSQGTFCTVLGK